MAQTSNRAVEWTESGLVPDPLIRAGIRRLNRQRLEDIHSGDAERASEQMEALVQHMHVAEIAPLPRLANQQHYEVPAEFFARVLGTHGKYSCAYWGEGVENLEQAEAAALDISCRRAGIANDMKVLDLGCGWGSLSLWIASRYAGTEVVAVSNSASQRDWIEARARERGLDNIRVVTADMNDFEAGQCFDRVVSVEMFEHMRNWPELFRRIAGWLEPHGRFFMHIFCHRSNAYEFLDQGPGDWMSRHFFSGGMMPSFDLPLRFQQHLSLEQRACWNGLHYARTANAWLSNMDQQKAAIMPILGDCYGANEADKWFQRWRIFFMACAEFFAHARGQEWFVGHYVFARQGEAMIGRIAGQDQP